MNIEFSKHAVEQLAMRNISPEIVLSIILNPDTIFLQDPVTPIYTKLIYEHGKYYIYRAIVNTKKDPNLIIAAYKTSKIEKYGYPLR